MQSLKSALDGLLLRAQLRCDDVRDWFRETEPPPDPLADGAGPLTAVMALEQRRVLSVAPVVMMPLPVNEGDPAVLTFDFTDTDAGDTFTIEVDWGDGNGFVDVTDDGALEDRGDEHTFSTAAPFSTADDASFSISLCVTDNNGDVGTLVDTSFVVQNVQPMVTAAMSQTVDEGETLSLPVATFSDPGFTSTTDGTEETFSATIDWGDGTLEAGTLGVTPGMPGTPTTGTVSGTHTYADNGDYTVTVTVTDDDGLSGSDSFLVSVANVEPTVTAAMNQTVDEGEELTLQVATFSDPGFTSTTAGTEETFSATIDWGDGTLEAGTLGLTPGMPGTPTTGTVSGTHTYADNGDYTVTVTVTDDDGLSGSDSFLVSVANVNPVVTAAMDQTVDEGEELTLQVATFSDPGFTSTTAGTEETFSATIDWGDGTVEAGTLGLTPGMPGTPTTGTVSGTHTYADDGDYTVTVTVTDDDGLSGSDTFLVSVANVNPVVTAAMDQTVDEGEELTLQVATFSDPGFTSTTARTEETFSATIDWGDGTVEAGTLSVTQGMPGSPTTGTVSGTHTYADGGDYTVTVTVTDDDRGSGSDTFLVSVAGVAPTVTAAMDQMVDEGEELTLQVATFSDPGFTPPGQSQRVFSATIDWGDGTVEAGTLSVTQGMPGTFTTGTVSGTHTYADNGDYTVTVTVIDHDGGSGSDTFLVSVANVQPTVTAAMNQTVDEGETLSLPVATFSDPGFTSTTAGTVETFSATIDWGDGTLEAGTLGVTPGMPGTPTTGTVSGTHTYADGGDYTVTVTVMDDDGGSESDTFLVSVANVQPTVTAAMDQMVDEGQELTLPVATFSDPGFTVETFSATIDWGDGTLEAGLISVTQGVPGTPTTGTVSGTHTYADGGDYTVTVTVTDDDGLSGSDTFLVSVANVDPVVIAAMDQTVDEGETLSLQVATFSDPGFTSTTAGTEETFSAMIDWGDGTVEAGTLSVTPGMPGTPTTGTVSGTHTYADNRDYTVNVTVMDDDGGKGSDTFLVSVRNVAPTILGVLPVNEGDPPLLTLGFSDPGLLDTFTVEIDWNNDGLFEPVTGTLTDDGLGNHTLVADLVFPLTTRDDRLFPIQVRITDDDGGVASAPQVFIVNNVAPTINSVTIPTVDEGEPIPELTVRFSDPGLDDTFILVVDWNNDGLFEPVTGTLMDEGAGNYAFETTPALPLSTRDNNQFTFQVLVADDDGGIDIASGEFTVNNVPPAFATRTISIPDVPEGGPPPMLSFDFHDPGVDDSFTILIAYGDGQFQQVGTVAAGGTDHTFTTVLTGLSTVDNSTSDITVRIADDDQGMAELSTTATVLNVAPTIISAEATDIDPITGNATLTVEFKDPGLLDFDRDFATNDAPILEVDWGDGSRIDPDGDEFFSSLSSLTDLGGGRWQIAVEHDYARSLGRVAAGTQFTINVTITDKDNARSNTESAVTSVPRGILLITPNVIPRALNLQFPPVSTPVADVAPAPPPLVVQSDQSSTPPAVDSSVTIVEIRVVRTNEDGIEEEEKISLDREGADDEDGNQVWSIADLDEILARLLRMPANRYRVYQIQPDGVERIIVDVVIREGRVQDVEDLVNPLENVRRRMERSPSGQTDAVEPDAPMSADAAEDSPPAEAVPQESGAGAD